MNGKWLNILFVIGVIILTISCTGGKQQDEAVERVPVEVKAVALGEVVQSLHFNGDVKAELEVRVFSKIPDRIEELYVEEGDPVKKGQPIAKVRATTIQQAVRQAEAGLAAARSQLANVQVEYERAQRLFRENAMSKQQFDAVKTQFESVKAQVEQAEAAVTSAKSQFKDATITAPIDGIIGQRFVEAGDMANPAAPIATVVQMKRVKIHFDATEEDLSKLAVGQTAKVTVKAYPEKVFTGRVSKISPILDPLTRLAKVEVLVDNPEQLLKPGMYARVEVLTNIMKDVIVVPRFATIESTTLETINGDEQVVRNYYAFVIQDSMAQRRKLDVSYANHKHLAVRGGIQPGELLVVVGQNKLRDGTPVRIVKKEGSEQ